MQPINLPMAELKPALIGLAKVIDKNANLPVLASVKVERTREGWITLTGSDLQRFVTCRLEQPTDGEPVSVVLPYNELLKTANKCASHDTVALSTSNEPGSVSLRYPVGKQFAEHRCESIPAQDFPDTPRVKGEPVPVNDELRQIIHEAMECASTDETRLILNGVFIDVSDPKCNQVVATDGRHLFASNSFSLPLKDSICIPDHKFLGWKGFNSDGEWQVRLSTEAKPDEKPLVQVSSRRWRFIMIQHEGNYPNYRQVIPSEFNTTVKLDGEVLQAALEIVDRIPCDLKNPNKPICLKVEDKRLLINGRNKDDAQPTEIEVPGAKVTGKSVTICCNRDFVLKALEFGLSHIEITDELSPLRFSNAGKQMIVMPVRLKEPDAAAPTASEPQSEPVQQPQPPTERSHMVNNTTPEPVEAKPALETAMDQLEELKDNLKANLASVTAILSSIKTAQREQKVTEKEYSALRGTLRSLQSVRI